MEETHLSSQSGGTLHIKMPDGSTRQVPLLKSELTIGRSPDNDLVLDHPTVSRHHARLTVDRGQAYIEDLGSSNGTYIGDKRLDSGQRVELPSGQPFDLGHVSFNLERLAMEAPQPEVQHPPVKPPPIARAKFFSSPSKMYLGLGGIVAAVVLLLCVAIAGGYAFFRGQRERKGVSFCDQQPVMPVLSQGGKIFSLSALKTAVAWGRQEEPTATATLAPDTATAVAVSGLEPVSVQPLLSTSFLELPFPFDGGNENFGGTDEQFRVAVQRHGVGEGGRINSYFDHFLPLYPAPKSPGAQGGQEPAEAPVGNNVLPFYGVLDPYVDYSGHPALDFSTFVYRQPTTPVFAAADGTIFAVGKHSSGALYVKIKHTIVGVGDFLTIYWHLNPDQFFDAMMGREGQPIKAGTRIGTMGNTGFSTGHHLHFEVRFDRDKNGTFSLSETVDPFGFIPSTGYDQDPWFKRSTIVSNYLWIHPLGTVSQVPGSGGGKIAEPGGKGGEFPVTACTPPDALPPGGRVFYSWIPDPDPNPQAAGVGQGCVLSVLDANGQPVDHFDQPFTIVLPFTEGDLKDIDPKTLKIYWQVAGSNEWTPLDTQLDMNKGVAVAETDRPGKCALLGQPTADHLPPLTSIQISGPEAADGAIYSDVSVNISSSDPSGIQQTFYSLDNGSSWQPYSGPFTVQPNGIPANVVMDEQAFAGGPGTFVVLAYSVDKAGNIEDPPVYAYFTIDPSKDPNKPTVTPTPTPTPTSSPTPTRTSTPTPTRTPTLTSTQACMITLTLKKNANCRKGPGTVYDVLTSYTTGQQMTVDGYASSVKAASEIWLWVKVPDKEGFHCWVSSTVGDVSSDYSCLPVIPAPPTPTPSPTPLPDTQAPPAPVLLSPPSGDRVPCSGGATLTWAPVDDPSGIDRYEWRLTALISDTTQVSTGSTSGTSFSIPAGQCGSYHWTVRAVDGAGNVGPYAKEWALYLYYASTVP